MLAMRRTLLSCWLVFSIVSTAPLSAETNWPQWRGPTMNGVAAGTGYPLKWSTTDNVVWKYPLPGIGASTPAIWGNKIFLSGESGGKNSILCIDRTGKKQWETTLDDEKPAKNRGASGSNPSPTTDGSFVFGYYKSGMFACLDMDGNLVWKKNLQTEYGADTLWWDLGTSPVLTKQHVIVVCMQSGTSYIAAFEKSNGKVAWKHERTLEAPGESAQSYTTPVVLSAGEKQLLIILGADHVTAHDAASGKQVWVAGNLNPEGARNWRSISSPVVSDGLVIAPYGRGRSLTGIRLGGQGNITASHIAWQAGPSADVPTPVAADGKVYVCTDRGRVIMADIKTGKHLSQVDLPSSRYSCWSSPILAAGHLYVTDQIGTTSVIKVGDKLELVGQNKLEDYTIATPVFVDSRIFLRTDQHLYCLGTAAAEKKTAPGTR